MSIRSVMETIILMVAILMGAIFNAESKVIIYNFIVEYQFIAAAIIGSIIAATIAVVGLFCAYYFNNKVQEQRLKNDIMNTARQEITEALREYQTSLSEINKEISDLDFLIDNDIDWQEKLVEYRRMFHSVTTVWHQILEDYQILFPETKNVIIQLQNRDVEISNLLTEFHHDLMLYTQENYNKVQVKAIIRKANITIVDYILDQIYLMKDLRIYLQNRSLSPIIRNTVRERQLIDPSTPKIIMNIHTGLLEINNNVAGITQMGKEIFKYDKKKME